MGGLATTIGVRVIGGALERSGSLLFQKITRLKKIDKELSNLAQNNSIAKAALDDFEIILGSYQGIYSQNLAKFIEELQRTGLIEVIAQNALIGRQSTEIEASFLNLYCRFFPENLPSGQKLFTQMQQSFFITITELTKDPFLHAAVQGIFKELSSKLDLVESQLRTQNDRATKQPIVMFDELQPTLARMARGQQSAFRNVKIETNKGAKSVDITSIYVPPSLSYKIDESHRRSIRKITRLATNLEPRAIENNVRYSLQRQYGAELADISYNEISKHFHRVVILGNPGGGKSTFCQKICYDLSRQSTFGADFNDVSDVSLKNQRLPLRVIIRQFETARQSDTQLDIFTYIIRDLTHIVTD